MSADGGSTSATRAAAVELLNQAKISDAQARATAVLQVAELVVRKEPCLIPEFLPALCELQIDSAPSVRRLLAGILEDVACVTDAPVEFMQCERCLVALLGDSTAAVLKRSISAAVALHRIALRKLDEGRWPVAALQDCWAGVVAIRDRVVGLLSQETTSGPVRMLAVKFAEGVVLMYTNPQRPATPFPSLDRLHADADMQVAVLAALLQPGAGMPNQVLLVAMQSCWEIARQRTRYYPSISQAFYELGSSGAYLVGSGSGPEASVAHALKKHLMELIRVRGDGALSFRSKLVEALTIIGAADDAVEAVRKADKSARREQRAQQVATTTDEFEPPPIVPEEAPPAAPLVVEPPETGAVELHQVRVLLSALLAKGDVATLRGFVTQLPGVVLADVVLANMEHLPAPPPATEKLADTPSLATLLSKMGGPAAATVAASSAPASTADPRQQRIEADTVKVDEKDAENDASTAPAPSRPAPPVPPPRVAPAIPALAPGRMQTTVARNLQRSAVQRILRAPGGGRLGAFRAGLLAKLAAAQPDDAHLCQMLTDAILKPNKTAPKSGHELAVRWLHSLFAAAAAPVAASLAANEREDTPIINHAVGRDDEDMVKDQPGDDGVLPANEGDTTSAREEDSEMPDGRDGEAREDPIVQGEREDLPQGDTTMAEETAIGDSLQTGDESEQHATPIEVAEVAKEERKDIAEGVEPQASEAKGTEQLHDEVKAGGEVVESAVVDAEDMENKVAQAQDNMVESAGGESEVVEVEANNAVGAVNKTEESSEVSREQAVATSEEGTLSASAGVVDCSASAVGEERGARNLTGETTLDAAEVDEGQASPVKGDGGVENSDAPLLATAPESSGVASPAREEEAANPDAEMTDAPPEDATAGDPDPDGSGDFAIEGLVDEEEEAAAAAAAKEREAAAAAAAKEREAAEAAAAKEREAAAEAAAAADRAMAVPLEGTPYEAALMGLLDGLRAEGGGSRTAGPALLRLLADAPPLPTTAISAFLASLVAAGPEWAVIGLRGAWELLASRPPLRSACLRVVLDAATSLVADVRQKAVRLAANRLFPERHFMAEVEEYASTALRQEDAGDGEAAAAEARCELYMALCTKKHTLLRGLLQCFGSGDAALRQAIQKQAKNLALTVGAAAPSFLAVVAAPPEGSELLVLKMLHVLTEEAVPPAPLVEAIMIHYHETEDARFLPPALGGMPREEAVAFLPQLVTLESRAFLAALSRLLERRQGKEALFTPAELLVAIHSIEISAVPSQEPSLDQVKAAIQACLNNRRYFGKEALAQTLGNMKQMTPLPKLFMWTVICMSRTASELVPFILGLLREITPKVWGAREQWQGFVMCCKLLAPGSFPLLAELSPEMLAAAAKRLPRPMLDNLRAFAMGERCQLAEVQRRRVAEVIDAATESATGKVAVGKGTSDGGVTARATEGAGAVDNGTDAVGQKRARIIGDDGGREGQVDAEGGIRKRQVAEKDEETAVEGDQ